VGPAHPTVDTAARQRLTARFGGIKAWLDGAPALLTALAERWRLELGAAIPRGSVSLVFRCRTAGGQAAVLKVSPDGARIAAEATALRGWDGAHTAAVLADDERLGALLIEAIEPGTPLDVSLAHPAPELVADLLLALHASPVRDRRTRHSSSA
jgi:streptomycin 6-kinase